MKRTLFIAALFAFSAITFTSCGKPGTTDTHLLLISGEGTEITALSDAWMELDAGQIEYYLSCDDPRQTFVESYTAKQLLTAELEASGYLNDPGLVTFRNGWLRLENSILASELLRREIESGLTSGDLERFRNTESDVIWFTSAPGTPDAVSYEAVDSRALPSETVEALLSLEPGETQIPQSGDVYRLDMIVPLPESDNRFDGSDSSAVNIICIERSKMIMAEMMAAAGREYEYTFSPELLKLVALGMADSLSSEILITSQIQDWTVEEFLYEVNFLDSRMPVQANSVQWLEIFIDTIFLHSSLMNYTVENYPEQYDSLLAENTSWFNDFCLQEMYNRTIAEGITVTDSDIEEEYSRLDGSFMLEERRFIETAIVPDALLDDLSNSDLETLSALPPLERLSRSEQDLRISRPLRLVEVPAQLGETVFALEGHDTLSWHGPFPIEEVEGSICFRLAGIVPSREPEIHEIEHDLTVWARRRLEEEALDQWISELYEKYEVEINTELLLTLPEDPSLW